MTSRQPRIPLEELCRLPTFFFPLVSWKGDKVGFYWDKSGRMELYVMDLATKSVRQLSHGEVPRSMRTGFAWSRDDRFIAFGKDTGGNEQHDLYKIEVETGKVEQLTSDRKVWSVRPGSQDTLGDWHPDGRRIAATSDASGQNRAGIVDIETGDVRWYSPEGIEEHALRFSKNGKWLVTIRNQKSEVRPILYDVDTGKARDLVLPAGFALGAQFFANDTKLLINYSTDVTRPALVAYDLATDTAETLIEPEYGSIEPKVFVSAEHVWYETFDQKKIPALLYRPREIAPAEKLPALVHVHGGPTGQWFRGFDPFAQFLVDRGFVVLEPNIRGSTGYGVEFRDAALKDWGGADLEDVAAGADYVSALPYVDPERLVVFGGSYGGFMTFVAATKKPDLWRAAVAWVGVSDLHRMWDESKEHFRYFLREQMGDPEKDRELWRDRSAIEFADQMRAKLLMVHGVNDPRCPVSQSRIFRDKLIALGKREGEDFEYVELDDEGHGSADIQQKIRTFAILADYLERVL